MVLNSDEKQRYFRQLILAQFGEEAQLRLKKAKVFIVGAGGLGGPVSFYLAAAGVGHIIICDRDVVELSNLNRQILHGTSDINCSKADSAKNTLTELNPGITIETHKVTIDDKNISDYATGVDIIIDCLDNVPTRLMINKFAVNANIPIMHAGIDSWTAQLTLIKPGLTPCLQCLFNTYEEAEGPKPVIGAMAGVTGTVQALETLKYLSGVGETLENKLAYFDSLNMEWAKIPIFKNEDCMVCK